MAFVPSRWHFEAEKNYFYIVRITGECNNASVGKQVLIQNSIRYIELAQKYKGSVWPQKPPEIKVKSRYTIQMQISFMKEEELVNFLEQVDK